IYSAILTHQRTPASISKDEVYCIPKYQNQRVVWTAGPSHS
ncbi:hypothetical protein PybrP1_008379, partial [[Pythium] brassicae (nom. inval.)]